MLKRIHLSSLILVGLALTGCSTLTPPPPPAAPASPLWRSDLGHGAQIAVPSGMTLDQAIAEVTSRSVLLLGTPYRFGGSHPAEGLDCSGLIHHVFLETFGLRLPRTTAEQAFVGRPISRNELAPGDLVFFNTLGPSNSHVAVYLGGSRFVHAPTARGVVRIESLNQHYWASRFTQARRLIARN